jgi:hypothetical protein
MSCKHCEPIPQQMSPAPCPPRLGCVTALLLIRNSHHYDEFVTLWRKPFVWHRPSGFETPGARAG